MFYPKKTVSAPWNKTEGKITLKGTDKDGKEIYNLAMPDYTWHTCECRLCRQAFSVRLQL